jgi:hypothetical protein
MALLGALVLRIAARATSLSPSVHDATLRSDPIPSPSPNPSPDPYPYPYPKRNRNRNPIPNPIPTPTPNPTPDPNQGARRGAASGGQRGRCAPPADAGHD